MEKESKEVDPFVKKFAMGLMAIWFCVIFYLVFTYHFTGERKIESDRIKTQAQHELDSFNRIFETVSFRGICIDVKQKQNIRDSRTTIVLVEFVPFYVHKSTLNSTHLYEVTDNGISYFHSDSGILGNVEKGDTISKEIGSTKILIKRVNSNQDYVFEYDWWYFSKDIGYFISKD